jgi:hypothetical protein
MVSIYLFQVAEKFLSSFDTGVDVAKLKVIKSLNTIFSSLILSDDQNYLHYMNAS